MEDYTAILQMVAGLYEENKLFKEEVENLRKINKKIDCDANTIYRRVASLEQLLSTIEADLRTALGENVVLEREDIEKLLETIKRGV